MTQTNEQPVFDMAEVLKKRVSDRQPLYVAGTLDKAAAKLHVATVDEILQSTGKPLTVVHLPN